MSLVLQSVNDPGVHWPSTKVKLTDISGVPLLLQPEEEQLTADAAGAGACCDLITAFV